VKNGNSSIVDRIVAHFGGQNGLARALDTSQSTIWGWKSRDVIPSKRIPAIIEAASRLDPPVELSPADFFDLERREAA
jgi:hypothetical protein